MAQRFRQRRCRGTGGEHAEAGDSVLLYGDESEALTHPYLARALAKAGADLRVPAPGQAKKVAMLGSLDHMTRLKDEEARENKISGLTEAKRRYHEAGDTYDELAERLAVTPATTVAGAFAKARVMRRAFAIDDDKPSARRSSTICASACARLVPTTRHSQ